MDLLPRFIALSLRENQVELQLFEARRNQYYMMQFDNWQAMKQDLRLA
jgi:hypothetical protein